MTEKNLFKDEYIEKKKVEAELKKRRLYVYLLALYKKLNFILMWIALIVNASVILLMLNNFNVGLFLFILNQYFVLAYYIRIRKERKEKVK